MTRAATVRERTLVAAREPLPDPDVRRDGSDWENAIHAEALPEARAVGTLACEHRTGRTRVKKQAVAASQPCPPRHGICHGP